jgi:hypothetical protein
MSDILVDAGALMQHVVLHGTLDAAGRHTADVPIAPLTDGELPGLQALIGQRTHHSNEQATAAFWLEHR